MILYTAEPQMESNSDSQKQVPGVQCLQPRLKNQLHKEGLSILLRVRLIG